MSFAVLFGAIVAALLLRNVAVAGRRPIGWAVAAAVSAAAIEPAVSALSRRMKRGLALLCVLVPLIALVGVVGRGVTLDLDRQTERLQRSVPQAAEEIERSDRFGGAARELRLAERARDAVADLRKPSSRVAGRAAGGGSAWLLCLILTVFALGWGPRFSTAALAQVKNEHRRARVARIASAAFTRSQAYVEASLIQAAGVGLATWVVLRLFDVPAPTPLALLVAVMSLVPVIGIFVGSLPAILVVAGLQSWPRAGWLLLIMLVAQGIQVRLFRSITRRTLYVGPATVVIAFLLGSDIYGLGGAVFGTAIAVFVVALVDAAADELGVVDEPPAEADPTEANDPPEAADPEPASAEVDPVDR